MKRIIYALVFLPSLLFNYTCLAQKQSFGVISYTVPAGYGLIKNDNVLTYYKEDKSTGAYCNFFVYKQIPGKGSVQQDFDIAWTNQVQTPFKVTGLADMQPTAALKGWQFLTGTTNYLDNGVATLAMLITFSGENNMQSICMLSNSDKYKADIESFIASVDVVRELTQPASAKNSNTASAITATDNSILGARTLGKATTSVSDMAAPSSYANIKYEVWECNCANLETGTLVMTKLNTVVISPDDKYLTYMPQQGLNGVTPQNSNGSGSWGSVIDKGNMLSLVNDKYGKMELYKIDATTRSRYPNSKSSIYKKVQSVDRLRIEGAYSPELSYYNGKTDIISRQIDPNKRPIIFFKKDGTYINEGIGFSNITLGDDFAIGKGTYEIMNYSLILTTQSGRKLQVALTPLLDATPTAADNGGLMINNSLFYRLNNAFVPRN